ncbi:NAD(P)-binding protein [Daldinia loculata]|uniref:NAD(P)-binding protein n=1 Tax=Daldinia loculata TaxID=103429 RepID=UPI0020C21D1E|nr:NAD(P)-binding protein [Daldinia loculata]KAI1650906.1 NAD(P)-binding protein [Daldinia loculata]
MVKLDIIRSANAALANSATKPYVAVVAGGTAGIGESAVRALAATFADRGDREENVLRVHIVGRNEEAGRKIVAECSEVCSRGMFRFHKGDMSLLREVDRVCADITRTEQQEASARGGVAKIDFLVNCQGVLSLTAEDTKEGLDKYYSLLYYSRARFVERLLPLLTASPGAGHVVSVLNASIKEALVLDDLALRNPKNQKFQTAFAHLVSLTNIFFEEVARRNPGRIALCHQHPGYVPTDIALKSNFPWWLKFLITYIVNPLFRPWWVPFEECGQNILFMASPARFPARRPEDVKDSMETPLGSVDGVEPAEGMDGDVGSGAYRVNKDGDTFPKGKGYGKVRENGTAEKVYQHTMAVFAEIEAGRVFKG